MGAFFGLASDSECCMVPICRECVDALVEGSILRIRNIPKEFIDTSFSVGVCLDPSDLNAEVVHHIVLVSGEMEHGLCMIKRLVQERDDEGGSRLDGPDSEILN